MKIVLLSDSHYKSIYKLDLSQYNYVLHAGDLKATDIDYINLENNFYVVAGNCDYQSPFPYSQVIEIEDKKFLLTHSHLFNTKESYNLLIEYAKGLDVDFVVFGHTHIPIVFKSANIVFINPGSFMEGDYMVFENGIIYHYEKKSLFSKKESYRLKKKYELDKML